MSQRTRLVTLDMEYEAAIVQIRHCLAEHDVCVVRSLDLQSACAAFPDMICPHHGDAPCDCQLVVLLAYGEGDTPTSIVLHAHRGQTEIDLFDSPDQVPSQKLVSAVHMALVEQDLCDVSIN
jgi:hypothetical protein